MDTVVTDKEEGVETEESCCDKNETDDFEEA
jgi:hypothetical protein